MPEDGPEEIGLSRLTVARFEFHLFCAQRCLAHPFAEAHAREGALGEGLGESITKSGMVFKELLIQVSFLAHCPKP